MPEPWFGAFRERAEKEPLGVDISDFSDDFCVGFLAGQANALDALVLIEHGAGDHIMFIPQAENSHSETA